MQMIRRYSLIAFVLLFLACTAFAAMPPPLRGTVRMTDGTPVVDATVLVRQPQKHALTNERGQFRIMGLRPGTYEIEISSVEIKKKTFRVELDRHSAPLRLVVEPAMVEVGEVTVTGQSAKGNLQTRGFAVDVVETQKFALRSTQTTELLDRTAGVRIRQDGGLGSKNRFSINGFSGNAVKIFIDGVPERNYGSSFSLSSIPPAMIERIEVYKGVIPGHLAEDALGGAINIILKKGRRKSLTTSYSIGSFGTHQWNGSGSFRLKNGFTFDASAFFNYSDNDYKVWGNDIYFKDYQGRITESDGKKVRRFNDAYRSVGGKFGVGFTDVKWADRFMLGGVLSNDYKEIQTGTTMKIVYGNRHYRRRANVLTFNYDKDNLFVKGLSLKMEASYSHLERENIDTVGVMYGWNGPLRYPDGSYVMYNSGAEANSTRKTRATNTDKTYLLRANMSYRIDKHHSLHANYLYNDFVRKNSDPYLPEAEQRLRDTRDMRKQALTFTYENAFFNDRLRTSLFYKHYFQRVTLNEPYYDSDNKQFYVQVTNKLIDKGGYGFTLSYALLPGIHLMLSGEKSLRLPSEGELFGNVTQDVNAAPALKPEESRNLNVGVDFKHAVGKHSFGVNAMAYYRDTRNMIREVFSARELWSAFANMESTETRGVDAELFYNYSDRFNMRFSISKFDVLFNTKYDVNGHPYGYYRTQIPNEPSFKFNGNAAYTFRDLIQKNARLSVHCNISYVKSFLRNWSNVGSANLQEIPTQSPVDAGITYFFPRNKVALNFDVKNIADEQVYDNYGLQKPGRSFHAKVTCFIF